MSTSVNHNTDRRHPARAMLGRDFRLFLREVPAALLIAALLGLFCVLASSALSHGADSSYTPAPVAVVDEDNSFTGSLAISMIAKQDFATPLEIVKTNAAKAEQGLADGSYSAVLYLPSGYAGDILVGSQVAARLVLSENAPLQADVVQLLCSFGEELLSTGQFGIFAGENLIWKIAPDQHSAFLKKANARFLGQAFADPEFLREELSYALTGVGAAQWYLLMYAAAFFQLMILGCFFVSRDCRTSLLRRMAAEGIGDGAFLGSKFVILFGLYLAIAAAMTAAPGVRMSILGGAAIAAAVTLSVSSGLALVLCLPRSSAVIAVTALTFAGLFASGGILPRMELPPAVTTVGDLLPLGTCARLGAVLLGGRTDVRYFAVCTFWTALAWAAMARRVRQLRKGVDA